jgi:hypothetical protein
MGLFFNLAAHPLAFSRNVLLQGQHFFDRNITTFITRRDIDYAIRAEAAKNDPSTPSIAVIFNPTDRVIFFELSGKTHADFAPRIGLLNPVNNKLKPGWFGARLNIEKVDRKIDLIGPISGANVSRLEYDTRLDPENLEVLLRMLGQRVDAGRIDWRAALNKLPDCYPLFLQASIRAIVDKLKSRLI